MRLILFLNLEDLLQLIYRFQVYPDINAGEHFNMKGFALLLLLASVSAIPLSGDDSESIKLMMYDFS